MKKLLQRGDIEILKDTNPVYILNGNGKPYDTEYKIMKNIPELLPCHKGILNEQPELVYIVENLVPLNILLPQIEEADFFKISEKLCNAVKTINANGFLNWQHIDLDVERIFIQPESSIINLIYLPIEGYRMPKESMDNVVLKFIASMTTLMQPSEVMEAVKKYAENGDKTIDQFISYISNGPKIKTANSPKTLILYNKDNNHKMFINKPKYLIGKKASSVDGVINYSQFVGRIHCQIITQDNKFYIYDLDSTNGTLLNGKLLDANKAVLLNNGDKLEIADILFDVIIEE